MSIKVFHGGRVPQSGGVLPIGVGRPQYGGVLPMGIGREKIFFPKGQVGYGIGGVLKPLARMVYAGVKKQAKKIPGYIGKLAKRHGKKAAQHLVTGVIAGDFRKGNRKKAVKRLAASTLQKAKKDIQKDIQKAIFKNVRQPKRKMKPTRKRKGLVLKSRAHKRRRKDIFDK